jgi:hypothetical protein
VGQPASLPLPRFLQPPNRRQDPDQPEMDDQPSTAPAGPPPTDPTGVSRWGLGPDDGSGSGAAITRKADRVPTRTESSSPAFESTPETAAKLLIGLGGIAVGIAAWLVRARLQRRLRRPTEGEMGDIVTPIGQILHRRWATVLGKFGPDVADLILAGAAAGAYVNNGPLTEWDSPDPGIPDNLQEEIS